MRGRKFSYMLYMLKVSSWTSSPRATAGVDWVLRLQKRSERSCATGQFPAVCRRDSFRPVPSQLPRRTCRERMGPGQTEGASLGCLRGHYSKYFTLVVENKAEYQICTKDQKIMFRSLKPLLYIYSLYTPLCPFHIAV